MKKQVSHPNYGPAEYDFDFSFDFELSFSEYILLGLYVLFALPVVLLVQLIHFIYKKSVDTWQRILNARKLKSAGHGKYSLLSK